MKTAITLKMDRALYQEGKRQIEALDCTVEEFITHCLADTVSLKDTLMSLHKDGISAEAMMETIGGINAQNLASMQAMREGQGRIVMDNRHN